MKPMRYLSGFFPRKENPGEAIQRLWLQWKRLFQPPEVYTPSWQLTGKRFIEAGYRHHHPSIISARLRKVRLPLWRIWRR